MHDDRVPMMSGACHDGPDTGRHGAAGPPRPTAAFDVTAPRDGASPLAKTPPRAQHDGMRRTGTLTAVQKTAVQNSVPGGQGHVDAKWRRCRTRVLLRSAQGPLPPFRKTWAGNAAGRIVIGPPSITLRYGRRDPDDILDAVARAGGPVIHVSARAIRFDSFPETADRAAESLRRARRVPVGRTHGFLKRQLYRAQYNAFRARFAATPGAVAVVWNGLTGTRLVFAAAARDAGRGCIHVERAPLPGRITVDPVGVNAASSLPRDPTFYHDWVRDNPPPSLPGWRDLGGALVARSSRRSGIAQGTPDTDLALRRFLFCPLQVQDDTQVTRFAGWCADMDGFLAALSDAVSHLPDGWHLRLKEHPSSKRSLAAALAAMTARHGDRVVVDNATDTFAQVAAARAVVTLNSSVGLQAFFHDRPVIVLGEALFRIPGVVHPADTQAQLDAQFAQVADLDFDARLRDAFMRYLDEVYYPAIAVGPDGRITVDAARLAPKFAAARAQDMAAGCG